MKYSETKLVIRHIEDTAYDSYISETLVSLKSAIKPKKQMRLAQDLVTSVKTIPARRTKITPSQKDHQSKRPELADTNRVVISQGICELKSRPQR